MDRHKQHKKRGQNLKGQFFIVDVSHIRHGYFLEPIINILALLPWILRGVTYMLCIFIAEYVSGSLLKKYSACPWDYSGSFYSVQGVIRLDYAPLWFTVGMVYEWAYRVFLRNF